MFTGDHGDAARCMPTVTHILEPRAVCLRVFTVPSDAHQAQMHDILYSCSPSKGGACFLVSVYVLTDSTNLHG